MNKISDCSIILDAKWFGKFLSHFGQYTLLFSCLLLTLSFSAQAQSIDKAYRSQTIQQLNELLEANYVFEDVAKKTTAHLNKQLKAGYFDEYQDIKTFAEALTKEVQVINKDKHMRIRPSPPYEAPDNTPEQLVEQHLHRLGQTRSNAAGFKAVKKLDGNIGYIDLRGFADVQAGAPMADRSMAILEGSDAMIIDLRKNGGGSPAMVQYLCSYFFGERVHLNSLYWRRGDRTDEFWTLDEVGGKKLPNIPLFVLTSPRTFSAAEEFSYNMQTQKRATLVGETTGGGANPGGGFRVNADLTVFIPTGAAINPITGTNWEGVGVVPEVKTNTEETLDKAISLATEAATAYREKNEKDASQLLMGLLGELQAIKAGSSNDAVLESLKKGCTMGILGENDINILGYYFMHDIENTHAAEALLKSNTILFPESANVYDSYGEVLVANGKIEKAAKSFAKAVELGKVNKDPNLGVFKKNLARTQEQIKKSN